MLNINFSIFGSFVLVSGISCSTLLPSHQALASDPIVESIEAEDAALFEILSRVGTKKQDQATGTETVSLVPLLCQRAIHPEATGFCQLNNGGRVEGAEGELLFNRIAAVVGYQYVEALGISKLNMSRVSCIRAPGELPTCKVEHLLPETGGSVVIGGIIEMESVQ